jgi:hypothetical protein
VEDNDTISGCGCQGDPDGIVDMIKAAVMATEFEGEGRLGAMSKADKEATLKICHMIAAMLLKVAKLIPGIGPIVTCITILSMIKKTGWIAQNDPKTLDLAKQLLHGVLHNMKVKPWEALAEQLYARVNDDIAAMEKDPKFWS